MGNWSEQRRIIWHKTSKMECLFGGKLLHFKWDYDDVWFDFYRSFAHFYILHLHIFIVTFIKIQIYSRKLPIFDGEECGENNGKVWKKRNKFMQSKISSTHASSIFVCVQCMAINWRSHEKKNFKVDEINKWFVCEEIV